MTEEEYWANEPDDENDIMGEYLIDEVDDDLTLIMMPKVTFDFEKEFDTLYRILKKCRTKEQMKVALSSIINQTSQIAILEHEIAYLQDRAKDLEFNISIIQVTAE